MAEAAETRLRLLQAQIHSIDAQIEAAQLMMWVTTMCQLVDGDNEAVKRVWEANAADTPWDTVAPVLLDTEAMLGFISQLVYCRIVDRFLTFLPLLAQAVYQHDASLLPDTKLSLTEVLRIGTVDQLVREQAAEAAHALTFKSSRLIEETFRLAGVDTDALADELERLADAVETRNSLIHRGGRIDELFVQRRPGYAARLGEVVIVGERDVNALYRFVDSLRHSLDDAMEDRYGVSVGSIEKAEADGLLVE